MDCRYRGNPPVLVLMADMAFECAWRLLAASWPDGVLMNSDPQAVPRLNCGWCILLAAAFSSVRVKRSNCIAARQPKLLFSLCSRVREAFELLHIYGPLESVV